MPESIVNLPDYVGPERRRTPPVLTEEQIEQIAEKAAAKAVQQLTDTAYREIGRGVVQKLFYIAGVLAAALYLYIQNKGLTAK